MDAKTLVKKAKIALPQEPIFHRVLQDLRAQKDQARPLFLAVSGGLDSFVMLHLLARLVRITKSPLAFAYVHHGKSSSKKQKSFRDSSFRVLLETAKKWELSFYSNASLPLRGKVLKLGMAPKKILRSEEELRDFRYKTLLELRDQWDPKAIICTAHHLEDLLETRLLRLIRGVGEQGLESMKSFEGDFYRPFLSISKAELLSYSKRHRLKFLKDPSNQDVDPLRNWLRNKWLPQLEKKRSGSVKAIGRSLELMAQAAKKSAEIDPNLWREQGIDRKLFLELSREDQRRVLAHYLRRLEVSNYSENHIKEILKRLDNPVKELKFPLLKLEWSLSPDLICASRVSLSN
jgi:tRNA(Ile)-lysidine synthase